MPLKKMRIRKMKKTAPKKAIPKTKKTLTKFINKVVQRRAEDKQAFTSSGLSNLTSMLMAISDTTALRILPNVDKGVDENQRIGEQIKAKSLSIRGYLRLNNSTGTNTNFSNVGVRLMVVSLKSAPSYDAFQSQANLSLKNLLQRGGTTTNFGGYIEDLYTPVNTELFTVHYNKVFYLNQSNMVTMAGSQDLSNIIKFFRIRIKCRGRTLKYSTQINSDLQPTNFCPILLCGYVWLNGSTPTITTSYLGIQYDIDFRYEDS